MKPVDPSGSERAFRRILVAVDGSKSSMRAAKMAARLANRNSAQLIVVCVVGRPSYAFTSVSTTGVAAFPALGLSGYYKYAVKEAETWLNEAVSLAKQMGVTASKSVVRGSISVIAAITDYAEKRDCDLIVVGTKGKGGFKRLLLGSVSGGVVNHASCSVLVVR